jgi:hypothetical protein
MKQLTLILTLFSGLVYGQIRDDRFIEISGRAERKVEPNLIYLTIELKEYRKDKEIIQIVSRPEIGLHDLPCKQYEKIR